MSQQKITGIRILRICACLGILLVHLGQRLHFSGAIRTFSDFGAYGVELLLVLSGYLSFFGNAKNPLFYYAKRAIRILPLYYLATAFYFITETFVWQTIANPIDWLRELFICNGIIRQGAWKDPGGTWTIHIFVCFYLLVPLLVRLIKNFRSTFVLFLISYLLGHFILAYGNGWMYFFVYFPYFVIGIIAYFAEKENKEFFAMLAFAVFALVAIIFSRKEEMIYTPLFGILLLAANKIHWPNPLTRVTNILDQYTFSMYLVHCIIVVGVLDKFELPIIWAYVIGFGGAVLLTVLVYHSFEKPIYTFLRKRVERKFEKSIK